MNTYSNQKIHLLLTVLFLLVIFLPACGPSQAEIEATATQAAVSMYATQTAQAPTATTIPTSTPTPQPTDTPTPSPSPTSTPEPTATPTPTPVPTAAPPIPMEGFASWVDGLMYELEIPEEWEGEIHFPGEGQLSMLFYSPDQSSAIEIYHANLVSMGFGSGNLEQYVDAHIDAQSKVDTSFQLVSREQLESAGGLPIEILVFTQKDGGVTAKVLLYVHEEKYAIALTYFTVTNNYENLLPVIEYTFDSFEVSE
jgi:hypothetical protein